MLPCLALPGRVDGGILASSWRSSPAGATASRPYQPDDDYFYLDRIATRAGTVDAAVEERLGLLPPEASL